MAISTEGWLGDRIATASWCCEAFFQHRARQAMGEALHLLVGERAFCVSSTVRSGQRVAERSK